MPRALNWSRLKTAGLSHHLCLKEITKPRAVWNGDNLRWSEMCAELLMPLMDSFFFHIGGTAVKSLSGGISPSINPPLSCSHDHVSKCASSSQQAALVFPRPGLSGWNELGKSSAARREGKGIVSQANFRAILWETILSQGPPDDWLIINGLRIDFYLSKTEGY